MAGADPGFRIGNAPALAAAVAPPASTSYPAAYRQYGAVSSEKILPTIMGLSNSPSSAWAGMGVAKLQRSLAWGFTLVLFTIYAAPTIIGLRLGSDPDNVFWIGSEGMIFATLPVIFVLQHVAHMFSLQTNAPKAALLFWCAAIPSIMCACVGGFYMVQANYLYGQLNAPHCAAAGVIPGVQRLQAAYAEATQIYDACYTRLYELNGNRSSLYPPRLQDCEEWAEAQNVNSIRNWKGYPTGSNHIRTEDLYNREWVYLASMEVNHDCGSFCSAGRQLWTGGPRVACSCSTAVAVKMLVVAHQGLVLLWTGLIALVVLIPGFMFVRPMLEKLGYA